MTFPSDLPNLVEQLAIAKTKLDRIEAEVAKLQAAKEEVEKLRERLLLILDQRGFTEEAVDLLLAAR